MQSYIATFTLEFYSAVMANTATQPQESGKILFRFERDKTGNITISPRYWHSMLKTAALVSGSYLSAHLNKLLPDTIKFYRSSLPLKEDENNCYEILDEGYKLEIKIAVSGDIPIDDLKNLIKYAGQFVGFSPAKAHKGAGRFKVIQCEVENIS